MVIRIFLRILPPVGFFYMHIPVKKTGCWFVGGDDLTGALHDL